MNGVNGCSKRARILRRRPICDNLLFYPMRVLQKILTRKHESLVTMRAQTLFKYGTE